MLTTVRGMQKYPRYRNAIAKPLGLAKARRNRRKGLIYGALKCLSLSRTEGDETLQAFEASSFLTRDD